MAPYRRAPSRTESTISFAILGVLAVIACAVYFKQTRYDPATVVFSPKEGLLSEATKAPPATVADLSTLIPNTITPLGPQETFGPENLAEKINGKAELYLSAGFVGLTSQRFQLGRDAKSWVECAVYDMGNLRQAFSVYSMQRRSGSQSLNLTPYSYQTGNALFFVHGKFYIEAVASVVSPELAEAMMGFGRKFVERVPAEENTIEEVALFPDDGMIEDSLAFFVSDAFGCQDLDRVFSAQYQVQGQEITAFIAKRPNKEDARALVDTYRRFLVSYGGKEMQRETSFSDAVNIDILGDLERFVAVDRYLVGVRDTDNWDVTEVFLHKWVKQIEKKGL